MIGAPALQELLKSHQVIAVNFAGHRVLLDAAGVLVWPQHSVLIFSDLHLEKGSFLSQFAHPLPRFDTQDTLRRMRLSMLRYQCEHIVCLGDSLHDGNAAKRMQTDDLDALNTLVNSVDNWTWVLGNHDPDIPDEIIGKRLPSLQLHNVLLVHEPQALTRSDLPMRNNDISATDETVSQAPSAQIVGHYHPKSSVNLTNRRVSGKSFICSPTTLLMPAFGKYTGGLDVTDSAFDEVFARKDANVYFTYQQKIYML